MTLKYHIYINNSVVKTIVFSVVKETVVTLVHKVAPKSGLLICPIISQKACHHTTVEVQKATRSVKERPPQLDPAFPRISGRQVSSGFGPRWEHGSQSMALDLTRG